MATKVDKNLFYLPISFAKNEMKAGKSYWKQILPYGTFKHPQDIDVEWTIDEEYVDEIIRAFNDGVMDKVVILAGTHENESLESTVGVVPDLRKTDKGLEAKMEITDDEIATKVDTKTSDGESLLSGVSVHVGPSATSKGEVYPAVLWHVAMVNFPWFTGMDDFVEAAAGKKPFTLPRYMKAENLSQRIDSVRNSYYSQIKRDVYDFSYVKEVHDEFIIVLDDDEYNLVRYEYDIEDDGDITFGEPEQVQVQYVAVAASKESNNMDPKDDKKASNEPKAEPKEKVEQPEGMTELFASMEVTDHNAANELYKTLKAENDTLKASNTTLAAEKGNLDERVASLEKDQKTNEATNAVSAQIRAGKIVPAQKEAFINLHMSSKESFDSIMAAAPTVIPTTELGTSPVDGDIDGSGITTEKVTEEIGRYRQMSSLASKSNGKES